MSPQPPAIEPSLVRLRVTELLDEFYGRIDRSESVANLLQEDAQFVTPRRNAQGRAAFADLMLSLAQSRRDNGRVARHFSVNVNIENLDGAQYRVRSTTIVVALDSGPDAKGSMTLGDHDDLVTFDAAGNCRFAKRSMTPVFDVELNPLKKS